MKSMRWQLGAIGVVLALGLYAAAQTQDHETKIQKKDVPAAVLAAFSKAFPSASVKGYAREVEKGQTKYEVECVEGKVHRDVTFSPDGTLLTVEESIEMKDVPAEVRQAFEKKYPNVKLQNAEKLTDGKTVEYEFHFKTAAGKGAEAKFDAQGREVKS